MNVLYEAALELQEFVHAKGWRYCLIGGLAVIRWGAPRATQDVDVSLLTGLGGEEMYVDRLLGTFKGRLPDTRQFALDNRVVLAAASNGVPLDIAMAGFPFEEQVISRASAFEFAPGVSLLTASAEDLIVLKAFAGREADWVDVEGIVRRQADQLDWDYVAKELGPLCKLKEAPESLDRLQRIRRQA